jgi:hypothetical protein
MTFDEYLTSQDLTMGDFLGADASGAFVKAFDGLTALYKAVKETKEADKDAPKVQPAHEIKWAKDNKAQAIAKGIVVDILTTIMAYEDKPAVMFHLRNEAKSTLVGYLTAEVDWQAHLATKDAPKVATVSERADMAATYLAARAGMFSLFGLLGHTLSLPTDYVKAEGSKVTLNLPTLQGNFGGNGSAGTNAKVYRLAYSVDEVDLGNDPKAFIRAIWHGADRPGKTTTDVANLVETNAPKVYSTDEVQTFKVGEHTVTIRRIAE